MIKIGIRNNLIYPLLLSLFILLCRVDEIVIKDVLKYDIKFIFSFFVLFPQFFAGLIPILYNYCKNKKKDIKENNNIHFSLIGGRQSELEINDSFKKIISLLIIDAYFNFLGIITGKHSFRISNIDEGIIDDFCEKRVRGAQIVFSSILCIFALKTKIYRHQIVSLITISCFLLIILLIEHFWIETNPYILSIFIFCFFIRGYLDVIEKYMFQYNYANPFKILLWEGTFGIIFFGIYSIIFQDKIIKEFNNVKSKIDDNGYSFYIFLFLLFCYLFFTGFRSIYRVHTVQYFSPVARALFELALDQFILIYRLFENYEDKKGKIRYYPIYCAIIISLEIIMAFLALIYNEFIILYCCGCAENTFFEIKNRAKKDINFNYGLYNDDEEEENNNKRDEKYQELAS